MLVEEVVVTPDICVAPGAYGTLQIGALVNEQENTPLSELEVTEAERNNTLNMVDVFSVHEILSTSTPEYFISILQSSSKQNRHSQFLAEAHYNSLPFSTRSMQSSPDSPSTIRNWHILFLQIIHRKPLKRRKQLLTQGLL